MVHKCECGFQFAGPGEFRNCDAFVTKDGQSGVVCPVCDNHYVNGRLVIFEDKQDGQEQNRPRGRM